MAPSPGQKLSSLAALPSRKMRIKQEIIDLTQPTASESETFPFLKLPPQIRNMIYRYLVLSRSKIVLGVKSSKKQFDATYHPPKRQPKTTKYKARLALAALNPPPVPPKRVDMAIAGTCKILGREAADIFLSENVFSLVIGECPGLPSQSDIAHMSSPTFKRTKDDIALRRTCALVVERVVKLELCIPLRLESFMTEWLQNVVYEDLPYLVGAAVRKFVRGKRLKELQICLTDIGTKDHAQVKKYGIHALQPLKQLRNVEIKEISWEHTFPDDFELEDGWESELRELAGGNAPFVLD
ncbi:MAG: hypothetical protein M1835_004332 [Candelina submexicana]|nr:MAG: hypothetical protein M1835_004332 [Candelina submexicana]